MIQLPRDCLYEIFENLDKVSLYSCLFVSSVWCTISVRILWKTILNYNTLLSCLPNESKDILRNEILVPTSKTPLFDYASFCKKLNIESFYSNIKKIFDCSSNDERKRIISDELLKLLVSRASLKVLVVNRAEQNITHLFSLLRETTFLHDLSELHCHSVFPHDVYHQLSEICHNIQHLDVSLEFSTSDGFAEFISVQRNLKYLYIWQYKNLENENIFFSSIPYSIVVLSIVGESIDNLYSLLNNFDNLQELKLFLNNESNYNRFDELNFSKLETLKFTNIQPTNEILFNFLNTHGINIKEFYINESSNPLKYHIIHSCPNIKKLFTGLKSHELAMFTEFIKGCQYLESIKINFSGSSNEKELFEIIKEWSQERFYEIELHYLNDATLTLLPIDLKSFIKDWSNRTSHKLSFIFDKITLSDEIKEVLDEYKDLGIIEYRVNEPLY